MRGQLYSRGGVPHAGGFERHLASFALPGVRISPAVVSEHADRWVPTAARSMLGMLSANSGALCAERVADGASICCHLRRALSAEFC